jgi:hypothetical protein
VAVFVAASDETTGGNAFSTFYYSGWIAPEPDWTLYFTPACGYLARAHDPPPGNKVMWRGLSRLTDIELGATIGAQLVGN